MEKEIKIEEEIKKITKYQQLVLGRETKCSAMHFEEAQSLLDLEQEPRMGAEPPVEVLESKTTQRVSV